MNKLMVFIDQQNFYLTLKKRTERHQPNWDDLPNVLYESVHHVFEPMHESVELKFEGIRVYASLDPSLSREHYVRRFFRDLDFKTGYSVFIKDRLDRKSVV